MFTTVTQGGQVHIHQLRMFKQIFIVGLLASFLSGGGYFAWTCWTLPSSLWRAAFEVACAKLLLATTFEEKHKNLMQLYTPPSFSGNQIAPYKRKCVNIVNDSFLKEKIEELNIELRVGAYKSLMVGALSLLILMVFWLRRGGAHKKTQHQRGTTFVPWRHLAKLIKNRRQESDLRMGDLPLIKDKETSHMLITGTTGSGKTNLLHTLLPQIRDRGNRAIIVDMTGDYVARYYNEATDLILNPLDKRSLSWHPWADCQFDSHYDVLADSLIQPKDRSNSDPFWDNASRIVFKTAMRKFASKGCENVEELYQFLMSSPDKEFCDFFKNTEAAPHTSENNEKTTTSIRSVLSSQIEGLRQLETHRVESLRTETLRVEPLKLVPGQQPQEAELEDAFSIRNWIMNDPSSLLNNSGVRSRHSTMSTCPDITPKLRSSGGWLFITARADQRKTLTPLISAWVDIAVNALMTLPQDPDRRLWFVIDELISLQKLPCFQSGLAEARKYGGCFLVGFQSKPQLEGLYGPKDADSMLDLFNTKVFFRCTEPSTQQWISKVLGDKEEAEPSENISYGANSMRDGVSLSRHTRQKPLVIPAELSQLEDLEAYVKLPGDYPCTKIQTSLRLPPDVLTVPFLLKPEKKRDYITPPKPQKK